MRNIKAIVAYDGSRYYGFQAQLNPEVLPTVQEVLEDAISGLLKETIKIHSAGRTDRGVHALGQVVHFFTDSMIPVDKLANAINQHLPKDVHVLSCEDVHMDFHARKSALGKHYQYRVKNSDITTVFGNQYFYQYPGILDDRLMHEACKLLEGTHNYQGFCSAGATVKTFVRTVYYMNMRRQDDWLFFDVYGNGFLYNMVRIMVGTLLFINDNKLTIDSIPEIIAAKDRSKAGKTVPPQGLYLNKVFY